MKKLIATVVLSMSFAPIAFAADPQGNMMQDDMMKNCQSHMKDGKMMDDMPKDMMMQCQKMMNGNGMMNGGMMMQQGNMKNMQAPQTDTAPTPAGSADHAKHHPQP